MSAEGNGRCQLTATKNNVIVKSIIFETLIGPALDGSGEAPEPWEDWRQDFIEYADEAKTAAEEAEEASTQAVNAATDAADSARAASDIVDEIKELTAEAETLPAGSDATADYDTETGVLTIGVPIGPDGDTGFSPTVTVQDITGGHRVTITDAEGAHEFDVMDGEGGGGTSDYADLTNKPQINNVTLSGNKSLSDIGAASAADVAEKYTKPSSGIPASDLSSAVQTSLGKADTALQSAPVTSVNGQTGAVTIDAQDVGAYVKPVTGIPASDMASGVIPNVPVQDVQVAGTSVLSNGIANVPMASANVPGVVISGSVSVSGTTPTINAQAGVRYVCGEVATISITPPAIGITDVVFTSGSTAAVLTVPNTVKWPAWFDPTSLDANTTYEINIMDGVYGAVGVWT